MKFDKLTGGAAVGAGLVVWLTHGRDFNIEEVAAMAAGLGAVVTYAVNLFERFLKCMGGES